MTKAANDADDLPDIVAHGQISTRARCSEIQRNVLLSRKNSTRGYSNVLFLPDACTKIPSNTRRSAQRKLSASEMDIATNLPAQIQHTRSGNQIPLSLSFDDKLTAGRDCIAADVRRLAKVYDASQRPACSAQLFPTR